MPSKEALTSFAVLRLMASKTEKSPHQEPKTAPRQTSSMVRVSEIGSGAGPVLSSLIACIVALLNHATAPHVLIAATTCTAKAAVMPIACADWTVASDAAGLDEDSC